ncbi:MAG: hypothetical protein M1352_02700 [Patescibacteria group bacterium]|nr:hypothetical protein [Patescibacteria group bacterium]
MTQTTLKLRVDYDQSVEVVVKAGKFDYANSDVTSKNFPSQRKGQANLEAVLVQFDRYMESDEVLAELDKMGMRAGTLAELLALGAQHPNQQREYPIVALGSVWRASVGNRSVPYLWGHSSHRGLYLPWFDDRWHQGYRFLAFRK